MKGFFHPYSKPSTPERRPHSLTGNYYVNSGRDVFLPQNYYDYTGSDFVMDLESDYYGNKEQISSSISSPGRKIIIINGDYSSQDTVSSPLTAVEDLIDATKHYFPTINSKNIETLKNDYICGVQLDGESILCLRKINCKFHTNKQKQKVLRSKGLTELLIAESVDPDTYNERRKIIMNYVRDPQLFHKASLMTKPKTIGFHPEKFTLGTELVHSLTSSSEDEDEEDSFIASTQNSIELIKNATPVDSNYTSSKSSNSQLSEKACYLHDLSKTVANRAKETIAYLHYRLRVYEKMSIEERVNDMNSSEAESESESESDSNLNSEEEEI